MALTPIDVAAHRGHTYAATSVDGQWTYQQVPGTARWSVTHTPTGRRYWVTGLDKARTETADGTAAKLLDLGQPLPPGKPLPRGEHVAIAVELSAADMDHMLTEVARLAPDAASSAVAKILPGRTDASAPVVAGGLTRILGVVYGSRPDTWVDALRAVRPDLIPPHLDRQPV